jgi:RNA polymerase sigma-70 factor (ECF subfamily)
MRAPSDGKGRSGSPRQQGLYEAHLGVVEGTAAATLEGEARMRVEPKTRTQKLTSENIPNPVSLDAKDEMLVAEAVRGSSAAFETLFQRHQQKMFHVALSRLQNAQDAEDAVQQAFQQAFVHLKSFQGQSRFSTWLTRITINESLMLLRKRRPGHVSIEGNQTVDEESFTLEIKDQAATPEEQYGQREIHSVLSGAIDELRPILKTVVNLTEIGELSTRKTAETLGVRVGTVKARTFRARRLLRDKIAKRLGARASKAAAALFSSSHVARNIAYQAVFSASAT